MTDLPPTYQRKSAVTGSDLLPEGYTTTIIRSYDEFCALKETWNALLDRNFTTGVWMRHEWIDSWWQAFGTHSSLFIPMLRLKGEIIGILPLMIESTKLKGIRQRMLKFIENGITPRTNFIMPEITLQHVAMMWQEVHRCSSEWDLAFLDNLASDNPGYEIFKRYLVANDIRFVESPARMSPYLEIGEGWDACYRAFGKRLKRNLANAKNRLKQLGEFKAIEMKSPSEIREALEICYAISRKSWKGELDKDIGGNPSRKAFYDQITEMGIRHGWASIWLLKLNEEYIAFEYVIQLGEHLLLLAIDYDQAYSRSSPGAVLRSLDLEQLAARDIRIYDFAGTNYDYKLHWTKTVRPHSQFWIFNDRIKSRLLYFVKAQVLPRLDKTSSPVTEAEGGSE